jgi:hypothetical protein
VNAQPHSRGQTNRDQKAVLKDLLAGFSDDIKLWEKVKSDARRGRGF